MQSLLREPANEPIAVGRQKRLARKAPAKQRRNRP